MTVSTRNPVSMTRRGIGVAVLMLFAAGCNGPSSQGVRDSLTQRASLAMAESADSAIRLYAALDTAGKFTCYGCDAAADSVRDMLVCWMPSENCSTDGPAWDVSLVASSYSIDLEDVDTLHATAVVRYRLIGRVTGGEVSIGRDSLEWRPTLAHTAVGWRITGVESQRPPVLSIASAMRLARTPSDSARLMELLP
jgi:hypothetical protein